MSNLIKIGNHIYNINMMFSAELTYDGNTLYVSWSSNENDYLTVRGREAKVLWDYLLGFSFDPELAAKGDPNA